MSSNTKAQNLIPIFPLPIGQRGAGHLRTRIHQDSMHNGFVSLRSSPADRVSHNIIVVNRETNHISTNIFVALSISFMLMYDGRYSLNAEEGALKRRSPGFENASALMVLETQFNSEINVGQRLRELRENRDLSIRSLAQKSDLSVNTLSLIENGKTSPSVATLQQLAGALGVPMTAFFETAPPNNSVVYAKSGHRQQVSFAHGTLENLGPGFIDSSLAPFIIRLEPDAGSGSQPIVHTGFEFVFCLKGRVVYRIENHTYLLEPGDSLLFESHLPHQWQNVESEPSEFLLILGPSDAHDRPTHRHFLHE